MKYQIANCKLQIVKWLGLAALIAGLMNQPPTAGAKSFPVSGNLDVEGWFRAQGIFYDTTGRVEGAVWMINATLDTAKLAVPTGTGDITGVTAGTALSGGGTSGTVTLNVNRAQLGSGTPSATTYLRGDSSWATPAGGGADGQNADSIMSYDIDLTGMVDGQYLQYNNAGTKWVPGTPSGAGDIEGVTAGDGLGGGGTSGTVTLTANALLAGGLQITTDSLELKLDGSTLAKGAAGLKVNSVAGVTGANEDNVSLTDVQTATTSDFHNIGGTDDDTPDAADYSNLTGGDGVANNPTGTIAANLDYDGALETTDDSINVKLDGNTLSKSASGLKLNSDFLDPADSAGVAYRAWVSGLFNPYIDSARVKVLDGAKVNISDSTGGGYATQTDIASYITAGQVPAAETDAAHDNFSELAGSATNAQVDEIKSTWCDSLGNDGLVTQTQAVAGYQPLEATLTDIADGTIAENLVNTANPFDVNEGGTGTNTLTDGGILLGSGTGAITALGVASNGQIPVGDGTTDPVLATITGTANEITVTNGAGTIALSLPDNISAVPLKKNFSMAIVNPKHLVADTSNIWANLTGVVYTIDSIKVETDGSVDDFDFTLVEMPVETGAAAVIEAMQVGTETGTGRRQNWFTAIDNGTIASGAKIGIVTPADSTDQLLIMFYGNLTP